MRLPDAEPAAIELAPGSFGRLQPADGERILWIHGYTMDSSVWAEIWSLMPGWYHIGIDLPNHGASRRLTPKEDLSSLADQLGRLAQSYDVRHIVALSFGTIIALQMAVQFPGTFTSLVLGAPALAGGPADRMIETRYGELALAYRERGAGPHLGALWMRSPPDTFKGAELRPSVWAQLETVIARHAWAELSTGAMYYLTNQPQTAEQIMTVDAATLIIIGEHELPVFQTCADLVRRTVPNCRIETIPDAGHLCLIEEPHASSAMIDDHLREDRSDRLDPRANGGKSTTVD